MADPTIPTRKDIEALVSDKTGHANQRMVRALERLFQVAGDITPSSLEVVSDLVETIAYGNIDAPTSMMADYIDFSPNAPQGLTPNRMKWSNASGTVNLKTSADNIIQIGQKTQYWVENNSGSPIERGKVVGLNGATASGYFRISLYTPGTSPDHSNELLGIVAEDIPDGEMGYVTAIGPIFSIDTSSWSVGTDLYATSSGNLTSTRPTAPTLKVMVAYVSVQDATDGVIHVKPYLSASIDRLHDVNDTARANGSLLIWNNTAGRYDGANLTAGVGITITDAAGSVTIINDAAFPGGASGSWTAGSGETITATNGVITSIV